MGSWTPSLGDPADDVGAAVVPCGSGQLEGIIYLTTTYTIPSPLLPQPTSVTSTQTTNLMEKATIFMDKYQTK